MATKLEKSVPSSDGIHNLAGVVYLPDSAPKGIVQVVHGMTEYIGRYDKFMNELAEDGYIVFGYDHLGHGHTVNDDSELGFIAEKDGWQLLVSDVDVFANAVRMEYGEKLPYILFGHSMGSFVVRNAATRFDKYDKLIVMGTGGPNPASGEGIALTNAIRKAKGERYVSKLVQKIVFGSYNDRFKGGTAHDWLSVKKENIRSYEGDKLCTFKFTISAMNDLMQLLHRCNSSDWFKKINKTKPILLISGKEDPVGDYGNGVAEVYQRLQESGANVQMKLYEGYRHELLQDYCADEVIRNIKNFIDHDTIE